MHSLLNISPNNFLWNAAEAIPTTTLASSVIRSHLLSKWKALQDDQAQLPTKMSATVTCPFCCSTLKGSSHIKVIPEKFKGKKIRRLQRKYNDNQMYSFTKYEASLWRKCQKNSGNTMVLTCHLCQKKSNTSMSKPVKLEAESSSRNTNAFSMANSTVKKKRKRAKDRFAGLQKAAVDSLKTKTSSFPDKLGSQGGFKRGGDKLRKVGKKSKNEVAELDSPKRLDTVVAKIPPQSNINKSSSNMNPHAKTAAPVNPQRNSSRPSSNNHNNLSGVFKKQRKFIKSDKLANMLKQASEGKRKRASNQYKPKNNLLASLQLLLQKK